MIKCCRCKLDRGVTTGAGIAGCKMRIRFLCGSTRFVTGGALVRRKARVVWLASRSPAVRIVAIFTCVR